LEAVPNALVIVDPAGRLLLVNAHTERLFRCTRDELLGQPVEKLVPERFRRGHPSHREHFLTEPRVRPMGIGRDLFARRKDGSEFPVEIGLNPLETEQGIVVLASIVDITERKRAEERFRLVVESAPNSIVMVDATGRIVLVNSQTEKLFGYRREDLIGCSVDTLVPERYRAQHPNHRSIFMGHPAARPMGAGRDLFGLRKDGSEFPVEIGLNPIETEQGLVVLASIVDITARKQAEEQNRFQASLLAGVTDAIIATDMQLNIRSWNTGAETMYGWMAQKVIGRPVQEILPDFLGLKDESQELPETRYWRGELLQQRRDGSKIVVLSSIALYQDAEGRPAGYVALNRDITERKQVEEQNRFLANLVATVSDAIIATDMQLNIQSWNTGAEAMYGWQAEDVIGQPARGILESDFLNMSREAVTKQILEQGYWSGEVVQERRDGTKIPASSSVSLYRDAEGKPAGVVAVNRDITERKRAEQELARLFQLEQGALADAEAAQERLSFLADATALLAENFDYAGRLNQVAQIAVPRVADWCAIDVLETDGSLRRVVVVHSDPAKVEWAYELQRRFPPDPDAPRGVHHVLRTGQPEFYPAITDEMLFAAIRDEEQLQLARGLGFSSAMTVPFQARGQAFGAITLVMAESGRHYTENDLKLMEDLARRAAMLIDNARLYEESRMLNAELEQRVRERTAELEAINKELETFSYSVSHDLRAPLRAINGFSQALSAKYTDSLGEQGLHYMTRIQVNTRRMGELIDDLLSLSRISRREMKRERVSLTELAREIVRELRAQDPGREATFEVEGQLEAIGDAGLIRIVLQNLLSNAWKFTSTRLEAGAHIQIGILPHPPPRLESHPSPLSQREREVVFFIRDNGVGFDMAFANKLFGAFQRLHAASEFPGTGIGLATVQRIIHRHGGEIWAEAEVDKGATFYFTLGE
jgi:PAS domain S-box-containing protein